MKTSYFKLDFEVIPHSVEWMNSVNRFQRSEPSTSRIHKNVRKKLFFTFWKSTSQFFFKEVVIFHSNNYQGL